MAEFNHYELSRSWWDFAFENPEKINPNHTAIYFFAIEHCNRLGWKEKYGLPTSMAMDAIGIKSYKTYIKNFNDLVEWGFIKLIEKSRNQWSSNIIALVKYTKANDKALDKAILKHGTKQVHSTYQDSVSIDKPLTINHKPLTINKQHVCKADKNLISEMSKAFDVNEIKNQIAFRLISNFAKKSGCTIDYFKSYLNYKKISGEKLHGWRSFIGDEEMNFENGAWCESDFIKKLEKIKNNGSENFYKNSRKQAGNLQATNGEDHKDF